MPDYPPAYPHGSIKQVFPNIFMVTGANQEKRYGLTFQFGRNMIIVKEGNDLTLINTMRLNEQGLAELDALGRVKNVVSIGCRHGKDDRFYVDHYQAKFWLIKGMRHRTKRQADIELSPESEQPLANCSTTIINMKRHKEGVLLLNQDGGILITCDILFCPSEKPQYYNAITKFFSKRIGMWKKMTTGKVFVPGTLITYNKISQDELSPITQLSYQHLLSAHGDPVLNNAKPIVDMGIKHSF